jgi:hypothetical protein
MSYAAIVEAFRASVEVEHRGDRVELRIASECRESVVAEMERVSALVNDRAWLRFLGPCQWFDTWVTYGEMRELSVFPSATAMATGERDQLALQGTVR